MSTDLLSAWLSLHSSRITRSKDQIFKWLHSPQYGFLLLFNGMNDFFSRPIWEVFWKQHLTHLSILLHHSVRLDQSLSTSWRSYHCIKEVWDPYGTLREVFTKYRCIWRIEGFFPPKKMRMLKFYSWTFYKEKNEKLNLVLNVEQSKGKWG